MRTAAFSIISPNYRHFARVLMGSLQRQHADWDRFVLVVGETQPPAHDGEPFTSMALDALPLPNRRQFFFRYTLLELNTAMKPWMFEHLFGRGYDRVVYFDPDIVIYSALAELDDSFITLTPHLTGSIDGDEHPSERTILQAGTYNLGFLAVTRNAQLATFLQWWQRRLEFQCLVDVARGLFVDQKWIDLVPAMFSGVRILRHDGYNVAYWNLKQRDISAQPLRFFHFSGFNPAHPQIVSRHQPKLRVTSNADVARLVGDYVVALRDAGSESFRSAPYAFDVFANGRRVSNAARVAYRNSAELQAAGGDDPFQHPELFQRFRDRASNTLASRVAIRSYRILSRARPLVLLFPKSLRTRMREFLLGRRDAAPLSVRRVSSLPPGLDIAGYFTRDTGVGESARLCANACEAAGIASHIIDVDGTNLENERAVHRAAIFHVNADQTGAVRAQLRQLFDTSAYRIGVWHWELPELPDEWIAAAEGLDEIWAPSAFIQSAIGNKLTIPVVHMPHGIEITEIESCSAEELGVPGGRFVFLCMFDFNSVMERKNPRAAIEAFRRAFGDDANVALLIKTTGADDHGEAYAALRDALAPNVFLADRVLSRARTNGLISACDAVVSLHRSEGFGLILAEAMLMGKTVIATGWSGNMDFMNAGNSCPIGFALTTLDRAYGHYAAGQQWAEPDVDHAAQLMRRVFEDASYRTQIGERARATIRAQFSPEAAGRRYRRRLELLGLMRDA
jgi:glycosyltransferase involved in cell wall biosynthesis